MYPELTLEDAIRRLLETSRTVGELSQVRVNGRIHRVAVIASKLQSVHKAIHKLVEALDEVESV